MQKIPFDYQVLVVMVIIAIIFYFIFRFFKEKTLPYRPVENIFTPLEKRFFYVLEQAVGDQFYIFAKVRMADVLLPIKSKDRSKWQRAFNKVACKHFDYVLCNRNLKIVAAIELDDASHSRKDRKDRDDFVDWACKSAGIALLRIKPQKKYDIASLRKQINAGICKKGRVDMD